MTQSKRSFPLWRPAALASFLLLGLTVNAAWSQAYDVTDWYGSRAEYLDEYDDLDDYFYDEDVYDPNDYGFDDNFYDHGYDSRYFPTNDARQWDEPYYRQYTGYPPPGAPNYSGIDRYYGPHTLYDGPTGLYERPYGYNNYYYDDNDLGDDYFTDDWYDDNGRFDGWY